MQSLAHRLLSHVRRLDLLKPGDRLGLAVSGGADSVALLRLLLELRPELGIVLSVVHFNHKLRGTESDDDEKFVATLARDHKLQFHLSGGAVTAEAATHGLSTEAAARKMRYEFFRQLEQPNPDGASPLDKIATAHTLDDQAETVLMRTIRGTGTRGLSGIHPIVEMKNEYDEPCGGVIRPLLVTRRREIERYLRDIGQPWREDSTNRDLKFTRNRVRHILLPLVERDFNPSIADGLAELAEIARGEEDYWENELSGWIGTAIRWSEPDWSQPHGKEPQGLVQLHSFNPEVQKRLQEPGPWVMNASIDLVWLFSEPLAVQRRAVKAVGDLAGFPLEFKHVEGILRFAEDEKSNGKQLSLPMGWKVVRELEALMFLTPDLRTQERIPSDYEYPLPLPGRAIVPEVGIVVEAVRVQKGPETAEYNPNHLLQPPLVSKELAVRNWRPGDRFWPVHTKSPKKVKELLQERHITGAERRLWPVVTCGDEIVWVRGFPGPASLEPNSEEGILIRELPLEDE